MKYNRLRGKQDYYRPGSYGQRLSEGRRQSEGQYPSDGQYPSEGRGAPQQGGGYPAQGGSPYTPRQGGGYPSQGGMPYAPGQNGTNYAGTSYPSRTYAPRTGRYASKPVNGGLYKLVSGLAGMLLSVILLAMTVIFIFFTASGGAKPVKDISRVKPGYEGKNGVRLSSLAELTGFSMLGEKQYTLTSAVPCTQPNPYMNGGDYTHSQLNAGRGLMYGIDVSSRNGSINWLSVRVSGIDFAILRAGSRGYTEGAIYEDKAFDTNARCALNAGVKIGAYFYSQATNEQEILQEAEVLLRRVKGYRMDMPVVLDFEFAEVDTGGEGGRLYDAHLSVEQATDMCLLFCRTVREAGYEPMVYANSYMLNNCVDAQRLAAEAKIWIAYPSAELKYGGTNDMWQYTWSGKVPGVRGSVDMDFGYYDR